MLDAERETKSDYLLVKAPGGERWLPFRDVFEVDGKRVREREERLPRVAEVPLAGDAAPFVTGRREQLRQGRFPDGQPVG